MYEYNIYVGDVKVSSEGRCLELLQYRAGGAGPTTPTLVGPKILSFMVKALYFQSYGWTNNCQIEVHFQMVRPILHSFRRPCSRHVWHMFQIVSLPFSSKPQKPKKILASKTAWIPSILCKMSECTRWWIGCSSMLPGRNSLLNPFIRTLQDSLFKDSIIFRIIKTLQMVLQDPSRILSRIL